MSTEYGNIREILGWGLTTKASPEALVDDEGEIDKLLDEIIDY